MQLAALVAVAVGFPTCFALASWSCHTFTASRGFAELQCPVKVDNRETASKVIHSIRECFVKGKLIMFVVVSFAAK